MFYQLAIHTYIVLNYETEDRENFTGAPPDAFSCTLLIDIQNEEGVTNWLESFSEKTKTTYRIERGSKISGTRVSFKTERICQHKRKYTRKSAKRETYSLSGRNKKTDCPSKLTLTIHNFFKLVKAESLSQKHIGVNLNSAGHITYTKFQTSC